MVRESHPHLMCPNLGAFIPRQSNHEKERKMSDKLKIMQEPVVRQPMLYVGVHQPREETLFYKFVGCNVSSYYIEVAARHGSLLEAIERMRMDFDFDVGAYCRGCDCPRIVRIEQVDDHDLPAANPDRLTFVSRLPRHKFRRRRQNKAGFRPIAV
jgi:hypothetical protein